MSLAERERFSNMADLRTSLSLPTASTRLVWKLRTVQREAGAAARKRLRVERAADMMMMLSEITVMVWRDGDGDNSQEAIAWSLGIQKVQK